VSRIDVTSVHLLLGEECEPRIAGADVDAGIGG
jgi:hypothetical protein